MQWNFPNLQYTVEYNTTKHETINFQKFIIQKRVQMKMRRKSNFSLKFNIVFKGLNLFTRLYYFLSSHKQFLLANKIEIFPESKKAHGTKFTDIVFL